ncbi:flagellar filament capping protein FliD [Ligilactobacillus sp. WILCCON 0076]|uniref:Flagellar hook-associated protein 2 n=1 Tax=Ligilactobacillus ubinensis TaxID=2876789 RepID=A0A9X2JLM3_9LACO|nr:flagellar filament capping protein FliD [Ligilactobacillus ubinensis]MCP0886216.1 flagellar filament capping protein FliD [Ligilactobacillus ubinensis]
MTTTSISSATASAISSATSTSTSTSTSSSTTSTTSESDASVSSTLGKYSGVTLEIINEMIAADSLSTRKTSDETEITNLTSQSSAWTAIKSSLSDLQTALDYLQDDDQYYTKTATSSNSAVATISGTTSAATGSYSISVSQLATAETISGSVPSVLSSSSDSSNTTALGLSGSLTLTSSVGSASLSVSSTQSLTDIASAINNLTVTSSDGTTNSLGITATVVAKHLVLTSSATGASNTISATSTDSTADSLGLGSDATTTAGKDASYTLDGYDLTSSSNTISDAINGATLTLTGVSSADSSDSTGSTLSSTTLTLTNDTSYLEAAVENFVDKYNATMTLLDTDTAIDTSTTDATEKSNGVLYGDSTATRLKSSLASLASAITGSSSSSLSSANVGLSVDSDGTMSVDTTKLESAISDSLTNVKNFFYTSTGKGTSKTESGYTTGFASLISSYISTSYSSTGTSKGIIGDKISSITSQIKSLNSEVTDLTSQLETKKEAYITKYTAVDAAMESAESTLKEISNWFSSDDDDDS